MKKLSWRALTLKAGYFTAALFLSSYVLLKVNAGVVSKHIVPMLIFYFIITLGGLGLILGKTNVKPDSFSKYYFIVMMARLFLGISFVWAGLLIINENRIIFVTNFLVLYLLYLGFEIYYLITNFQSRT